MRTTVSISDPLLTEARKVAAASGRTLSQVLEDALRESLARRAPAEPRSFAMPTFRGRGVLPGVDLDDSASLQDLIDQDLGPDRLR